MFKNISKKLEETRSYLRHIQLARARETSLSTISTCGFGTLNSIASNFRVPSQRASSTSALIFGLWFEKAVKSRFFAVWEGVLCLQVESLLNAAKYSALLVSTKVWLCECPEEREVRLAFLWTQVQLQDIKATNCIAFAAETCRHFWGCSNVLNKFD